MKDKKKKSRGIISMIFLALVLVFILNNAINTFKKEAGYLKEEQSKSTVSEVKANKTKEPQNKDINKSIDKVQVKSTKELGQELVDFNVQMKEELNKTRQVTKEAIEKINTLDVEIDNNVTAEDKEKTKPLPKLEKLKDAHNYWEGRLNKNRTELTTDKGDVVDALTGNVIQKADKNDTMVQFLEFDKDGNPIIKDKQRK